MTLNVDPPLYKKTLIIGMVLSEGQHYLMSRVITLSKVVDAYGDPSNAPYKAVEELDHAIDAYGSYMRRA